MEGRMKSIQDGVFKILRTMNFNDPSILFTLRKSDRYKRLSLGYWFHGNEDYLAVSFWSGTAWKNRTPNISLLIFFDESGALEIDVRDSQLKKRFVELHLKKQLGLEEEKENKYIKRYPSNKYETLIESFFAEDKIIIDDAVKENLDSFWEGKEENIIGFLDPVAFQFRLDRILARIQDDRISKLKGHPFHLKDFVIRDFTGIRTAVGITGLPKGSQWIFLAGENGSGKTSILKGLALGLYPRSTQHKIFIQESERNTQILIKGYKGKGEFTNLTSKEFYSNKKRKLLCEGFAAYGASRLITTRNIPKRLKGKTEITYSIFNVDGTLLDIESEIDRWKSQAKTENERFIINERLDIIKEALMENIEVLGDIEWSHVDKDGVRIPTKYFEADKDGSVLRPEGVLFEELASGVRSLIAMLGDMLLRLFRQQKEQLDLHSLVGVVLIDEIDVHLHPKMQRDIIEILSTNFPNIQFVVSTHSPIPLLGAPANSVILKVLRNDEGEVELERIDKKLDFSIFNPNILLTSPIFGFKEIFPFGLKDTQKRILTKETYDEVLFQEVVEERLNNFLSEDD